MRSTMMTMMVGFALLATTPCCKKSEAPKSPEPVAVPAQQPPPKAAPEPVAPPDASRKASPPAADSKTPASGKSGAPEMPSHWKVVANAVIPEAHISSMVGDLGGEIVALRNTVYTVGGKRVQLNIIDAADAANANAIMATLKRMKSKKALLRHEQRIFEFVGKNDVLAEIVKARRKLAADLKR